MDDDLWGFGVFVGFRRLYLFGEDFI